MAASDQGRKRRNHREGEPDRDSGAGQTRRAIPSPFRSRFRPGCVVLLGFGGPPSAASRALGSLGSGSLTRTGPWAEITAHAPKWFSININSLAVLKYFRWLNLLHF